MEVHIDDVVSTVRTVDGDALLSPNVMRQILSVVLKAVREERAHAERLRQEQGVSPMRDSSLYA